MGHSERHTDVSPCCINVLLVALSILYVFSLIGTSMSFHTKTPRIGGFSEYQALIYK